MLYPPKHAHKKIFEELLSYRKEIYFICLGFSRNHTDAEELTQDVFLKAMIKINSLKNINAAKIWLIRICRNTCLDHAKKNRIRIYYLNHPNIDSDSHPSLESKLIFAQDIEKVKKAIHLLPKKQKDVFILREYGDLSYREIAKTLKIKIGTVMSRLNRAKKTIVEKVGREL